MLENYLQTVYNEKMKTSKYFAVFVLCLSVPLGFAQTRKPVSNVKPPVSRITPVALGTIYHLPEKPSESVPGTNPVMMRNALEGYISVIEWHFEMRFTDAERKEYEQILIKDWNTRPTAQKNINDAYDYLNDLKKLSPNDLSTTFYNRKSVENWDILNEGMLNQPPKGLRGIIKKLAAEGNPEGVFVWKKINEYEKPLAAGNSYNKPLTRKTIDATTEWLAYQINSVANKEVFVLDDEKRQQMEQVILERWNKEVKGTDVIANAFTIWLNGNVFNWQTLRIKRQYSFDQFITNYNKLSRMVDWANVAVYYCPSVKPYAEQRVKEYKDYAAKMNDREWQLEFYRLQQEMKMQNMVFEAIKRQQLESHVLTLNILERNDSQYHWVIKEIP